jgi:GNAT superfamily N-acetyltransferase
MASVYQRSSLRMLGFLSHDAITRHWDAVGAFYSREEAEIKRLFVDTNARGEGVGGAIVLAIEQAAAEEGIHIVLLETGIKSFEAIRLYKRRGFMERGPFAQYTHDPLSVFMSKSLQSRNNSC